MFNDDKHVKSFYKEESCKEAREIIQRHRQAYTRTSSQQTSCHAGCPTNKTQTWQVSRVRRRQEEADREKSNTEELLIGKTYSAVICVTSGREVKPEPRNESRYWVIFRAASQSSTELTLLMSGAPRSNRGWWEGL